MIFLQTYALLIGSANCQADAMSLAFFMKPNLHLAGLGTQVSYVWGSCKYLCISFQLLSVWIVPLEDYITLLYMLEYLAFFFQISDKHRIQPQFLADFLGIECLRKRSSNTFVLIYHDGSQQLAPSLFLGFSSVGFKDDEKSSNVSRAHSTHSTCLTNGLWPDLRACKPNISMDQRVRFPSTKI